MNDLYGPRCADGDQPFTMARIVAHLAEQLLEPTSKRGPGTQGAAMIIRASETSGYDEDVLLSAEARRELDELAQTKARVQSPMDIIRASESQSELPRTTANGPQSVVFAHVRSTPEGTEVYGNKTFAVSLPLIGVLNACATQDQSY